MDRASRTGFKHFFFSILAGGNTPASDCVVFSDASFDGFTFTGFNVVTCLQFPSLTTVFSTFDVETNAVLATIAFGQNITFRVANVKMLNNPLLTTITFSGTVKATSPSSRVFTFTANALDQASVDGILAAIDAGASVGDAIHLEGGTNSTPSAAGLVSKANLIGKGWAVTNNP